MKTAIGIVLFVFVFTSCSSRKIDEKATDWDVTLKGKVAFPQPGGTISIRELRPDNSGATETIVLGGDNTFTKKMHLTSPGFYQLNFYNQQVINVILNKSDLEINVDGTSMQGKTEVKGSPEHDLIAKVQAMAASMRTVPELAAIEADFNAASQAHDNAKMDVLRGQYMKAMRKEQDKIAAFIKQQPASLGVLNLLVQGNLLDRDVYTDVYEDAAQKLKREAPNSPMAKEFIGQVEVRKVTGIGRMAPEIALPTPQGDTVRLSSLRGKYVLIDFWAKWCGPCRRENPNVVAAYNKFKGKGFEVYGVSLDRNKEDWMLAIQQDGLTWTQVSDLKYFESAAAKLYNVSAIPFSILLDPNGVIIAKNLRGADLENKLQEVLK
jgi:peroxiredoxin